MFQLEYVTVLISFNLKDLLFCKSHADWCGAAILVGSLTYLLCPSQPPVVWTLLRWWAFGGWKFGISLNLIAEGERNFQPSCHWEVTIKWDLGPSCFHRIDGNWIDKNSRNQWDIDFPRVMTGYSLIFMSVNSIFIKGKVIGIFTFGLHF